MDFCKQFNLFFPFFSYLLNTGDSPPMCSFSAGAWPHLFANPPTQNPAHSAWPQPAPHAVSMLMFLPAAPPSLKLKHCLFPAFHDELLVQTGSSANYSCCWLPLNCCVAKLTASYCSSKTCLSNCHQRPWNSFFTQHSMPNARWRLGLFYLPSLPKWPSAVIIIIVIIPQ